jgi:hypothetical protein
MNGEWEEITLTATLAMQLVVAGWNSEAAIKKAVEVCTRAGQEVRKLRAAA